MIELLKLAGVSLIALMSVGTFRIVKDLVFHGEGRIREVREEGGGVLQKIRGELDGGQRHPSSAQAHGLHISVERGGKVVYREKSVIAKEVA
jgi:hypothetical protein